MVADYVTLTKPRIMLLILITAYGAMAYAADGLPDLRLTVVTLVGLGLSSGGAAALNHYFDRDLDALMARTATRPIPAGRVSPESALGFGIGLIAGSFAVLAMNVNMLTAWLALGGALFYVIVYTVWLKRRTPQNIVIGGAAGAVPPLVGWAAVTGEIGLPAIFMFALIFYWTPPHFWALSLLAKDDYARAGIPMLPVVRGERETARQILLYTILLSTAVRAAVRRRLVRRRVPGVGRGAGRRVPVAGRQAAARHLGGRTRGTCSSTHWSIWRCCSPRSASTGRSPSRKGRIRCSTRRPRTRTSSWR